MLGYIKKNKTIAVCFFFVMALSLFTNFYHLELRHGFAWDQQRDAETVYFKMIKDHQPTLIGPRVVGVDGFFLGPLHYYLSLPFYLIFRGDPIAGAFLASVVGVFTTGMAFVISRKIFKNNLTPFLFSSFIALNPVSTSWNVMYIPPLTLLFYYFLLQIFNKRFEYIAYSLALLAILFQFHFSAVFLLIIFCLVIFKEVRTGKARIPKKPILVGSIIFLASFLPLIIFDLRHDFLNTRLFVNFFFGSKSYLGVNIFSSVKTFIRELNILPFNTKGVLVWLVGGTFIGIYIYESLKSKVKDVLFLNTLFVLVPIAALSFYSDSISEYYFATAEIVVVMYLSNFVAKLVMTKRLRLIVLVTLLITSVKYFGRVVNTIHPESLYYKKQIVKYLVNQKDYEVFNVSYSTYRGGDVGFDYLFRWYGRQPQDVPEGHLYTIVIPADAEDVAPIVVYGNIGLVRR